MKEYDNNNKISLFKNGKKNDKNKGEKDGKSIDI